MSIIRIQPDAIGLLPSNNILYLPSIGATTSAGVAANKISFMTVPSVGGIAFNRMSVETTVAGGAGSKFAFGLYNGLTRELIAAASGLDATLVQLHTAAIVGQINDGLSIILAFTTNDAAGTFRIRCTNIQNINPMLIALADARFAGIVNAGGGASLPGVLPLADDVTANFCNTLFLWSV